MVISHGIEEFKIHLKQTNVYKLLQETMFQVTCWLARVYYNLSSRPDRQGTITHIYIKSFPRNHVSHGKYPISTCIQNREICHHTTYKQQANTSIHSIIIQDLGTKYDAHIIFAWKLPFVGTLRLNPGSPCFSVRV